MRYLFSPTLIIAPLVRASADSASTCSSRALMRAGVLLPSLKMTTLGLPAWEAAMISPNGLGFRRNVQLFFGEPRGVVQRSLDIFGLKIGVYLDDPLDAHSLGDKVNDQ